MLGNTFNNGLLSSKNANKGENDDDDDLHEDESNSAPLAGLNISDAELFYTSPEWSQKIESILDTYAAIPLLSMPIIQPEINLHLQIPCLPLKTFLMF